MAEGKKPKGITVEISGDASGLNKALDEATEKADRLIEKLKQAKELADQINGEV